MASLLSLALRNAVEKENDKEGKEQDGVARFPLDEICDFFFSFLLREANENLTDRRQSIPPGWVAITRLGRFLEPADGRSIAANIPDS